MMEKEEDLLITGMPDYPKQLYCIYSMRNLHNLYNPKQSVTENLFLELSLIVQSERMFYCHLFLTWDILLC
jgi:hypothetical protein